MTQKKDLFGYIPKEKQMGELPIFQTQYNGRYMKHKVEDTFPPSLTVPDESMSIADLVRNHLHKQPILGVQKEPIYLGDEDYYPPIDTLDNIDRQDMLSAAKSEINKIQTEHQAKLDQIKKQKQKLKEEKKDPPTPSEGGGGESPAADAQTDSVK